MLYRNVHTGMVQDFSCTLHGDHWELVEKPIPEDPVADEKEELEEKPTKKKKVVK